MKRLTLTMFLSCYVFGLTGCLQAVPSTGDVLNAPGRETVLLDPSEVIALVPRGRNTDRMEKGAAQQGFSLREDVTLPGLELRMLRFTFPKPFTGKAAIETLETLDPTATAGVNHVYRTATTDQANRFDYANAMIAWPDKGCPPQGPIGLLDTGVNRSAFDGLDAEIVARSFARGTAGAQQHGTDVASVLMDPRRINANKYYSAAVVGRIQNGDAVAGVDALVKALDWMASENVRVVNVSLAGPYNKLLDRSVAKATAGGMTLVAAVGNDGVTGPPRYPAAFESVIAVTAVDAGRKIYRKAARGAHIDIAAPGVDIPVINANKVRFVSGTSMAAPYVTTRIATDPSLYGRSAAEIRSRLSETSQDLGTPGTDATFGLGLVRSTGSCGG